MPPPLEGLLLLRSRSMNNCRVLRPETIMSRLVRTFTLSAVLLHMVFGCCLHHAHLDGSEARGQVAVVETSCHCHHHGHEPSDQPRDDRSRHEGCDGAECVFTRPELADSSELLIGQDCLAPARVPPSGAKLRGIDLLDSALSHVGPPIALHLLNQALLL